MNVCVSEKEKERMGFPFEGRAGGCQGSFRGGYRSPESRAEGWGNLPAVFCRPAGKPRRVGAGRQEALGVPRDWAPRVS